MMLVLFSDIPRIPGLVGAIFRLSEARRNEILSQPTRWRSKWRVARPCCAGTRCFAFIKAHLCRRRLSHLTDLRFMLARAALAAVR